MQKPDLKFIFLTAFCVSIACAVAYIAYDIYSDAHRDEYPFVPIVRDGEKTEHEVRSVSKEAKEIFKEALEDRIEHHKK